MDFSANVVGLDDVVKALEKVDQRVSLRVIRASQRFAIKPAIERAKSIVRFDGNADGDGYSLRDNIGVRAEKKRARAGNATVMRFGAHRQTTGADDTTGYKIEGGLGKGAGAPNYAQLVNKETPFLLPALDVNEYLKRFGDKIIAAVSKL